MAVKLFVTDLDGTLLPAGTKVSERNIKAVQDAVKAGITVTIATGRMFRAALPVAEALGVNVPIITYNGALIKTVDGEVIHSVYLDEQLILDVVDFFEARGWYLQSYSNDKLNYTEQSFYSDLYEEAQKIKGHAVGWEGLRQYTENVAKLLSVTKEPEETGKRVDEIGKAFKGRLDVVSSNPLYVEMVPIGISKASAIKYLADKMGIGQDEIMAIGDSNNDLPMLKTAGKSIAMGNAIPEVKEACDYLTGTWEEDGFADAVYRYALGK